MRRLKNLLLEVVSQNDSEQPTVKPGPILRVCTALQSLKDFWCLLNRVVLVSRRLPFFLTLNNRLQLFSAEAYGAELDPQSIPLG
jgi:hypothetical protein